MTTARRISSLSDIFWGAKWNSEGADAEAKLARAGWWVAWRGVGLHQGPHFLTLSAAARARRRRLTLHVVQRAPRCSLVCFHFVPLLSPLLQRL
jgi:hypothetical protein